MPALAPMLNLLSAAVRLRLFSSQVSIRKSQGYANTDSKSPGKILVQELHHRRNGAAMDITIP